MDAPFKSCHLAWNQVSIDGVIYWRAYDHIELINGSLALLDYNDEDETGLWMRKDGENKPFTKIYTVKDEGRSLYYGVLGLRKNGEVVLEVRDYYNEESEIEAYEPSSGRISSVGIIGECASFCVMSYMETLLLLDEANTIIHS
ncbi:hypothetical protein Tco_0811861 [Tanacetum coccineum]